MSTNNEEYAHVFADKISERKWGELCLEQD